MKGKSKNSSTLVKKALSAMTRGGMVLSRELVLELAVAFGKITEVDLDRLSIPTPSNNDGLAQIKRELRSANGTAKVYIGYLQDCLERRGHVVPKASSTTLSGMYEFAATVLAETELLEVTALAMDAYRSDYDTAYRIRTG
jgi:hypothetical protein